jgi:hypothetical protein
MTVNATLKYQQKLKVFGKKCGKLGTQKEEKN